MSESTETDIALWICPECGTEAPPLAGVFTEHIRADRKDWCNGVARPITMRDVRIATLIEAAKLVCVECRLGNPIESVPAIMHDAPQYTASGIMRVRCAAQSIIGKLIEEWS